MSGLTADARPSENILSTQGSILNMSILRMIEHELDDYERISILFLMLENYNCFDEVRKIFQSEERINIISKFANNVNNWQAKFLEALCIVNNERLLINLGLNMKNLQLTYLPNSACIPYHINVGAKILYNLFNQFDEKEVDGFLNSIYTDIPKNLRINNVHILELHALYWIQIGKISIAPGSRDLNILLKHLKVMGYMDKPIYYDMEKYNKVIVGNMTTINRTNNDESPFEVDKIMKNQIIERGICIIINEVLFPSTAYETRDSSNADAAELMKTFKGLNFDVELHNNKTKVQIFDILREYSIKNSRNYDCFAICLLSHGYSGGFISTDGQAIPIDTIEECMCSSAYRNSVKILIIQACQGENTALALDKSNITVDGLPSSTPQIPKTMEDYRNFFLFISTMKNFVSLRHREKGSWFIQELCKVLQARKIGGKHISIIEWSQKVKRNVQHKRGKLDNGEFIAQLSESRDRLIDDVYFPFYKETDK